MGIFNFFDRTFFMAFVTNVKASSWIKIMNEVSKIYDNSEADVPAIPDVDFDVLKAKWSNIVQTQFPSKAIEHTYILSFIIEHNGNISNISISPDLDPEVNAHLIKSFKSLKYKWTPALIDNHTVRSRVCLESII